MAHLAVSVRSGGGASPLLIAGHRQIISSINKGSQNFLIILLLPLSAFALASPGMAPPLSVQAISGMPNRCRAATLL